MYLKKQNLQEVLQQDLDEKDDYQGAFQAPWGWRRRSSRRRRRRRRSWISRLGNFVAKHGRKIWGYAKKYHRCCTIGKCVGKKYCYNTWG